MAIRGRRQVGKSRLVQEFCDRAGAPYLFYAGTKGASPAEATAGLLGELADSSLPVDRALVPAAVPRSWPDTFRAVAAVLPTVPCIFVLDELPWLAEQDTTFDGTLQTAWDRLFASRPVLLLLLGSDPHTMERLTAYDRPFYGRADNLVLGPLNPAETGRALGLTPADAVDAHLICGGLPGILRSWPAGTPPMTFLRQECADPAAPVFSVPETSLLSEFPSPDLARRVLEAVGGGDRTHTNIAATAGAQSRPLPSGTVTPLLRQLADDKRVLAVDSPLSTRPGRPALYRVADSNLRLYLAVLRPAHELSRRGRAADAFALVQRRWTSWRGRAVEPLVRESLELAASAGALPWADVACVGGWWNRAFDPEVDLIGADRAPVAGRISFAGSIKWLATPVDRHDVAALRAAIPAIPGAVPGECGLVVATLSGVADEETAAAVDLCWTPEHVVTAWA